MAIDAETGRVTLTVNEVLDINQRIGMDDIEV
jgi:hypothetical protein